MGGPRHSHWRCTGPCLPEHQVRHARAVSKSPAGSAAEIAGPNVVRLTPVENSSESCEKVGEEAGWLSGVWKLKWCWLRIPCGVQFNANFSFGVDIVDFGFTAFSF